MLAGGYLRYMLLSNLARLRLALTAGLATYAVDPGAPLLVLRTTPSGDAAPTTYIAVTFDRPVAGSLDRSVDPASVLSINPAIPGRLEWRDPVTVRLQPARPLAPNAVYTVTVANTFSAMDGSRLATPYQFTFRVRGPRALEGWPVGPGQSASYLSPDAAFDVVFDAPPDLAAVSRAAYLEFAKTCSTPGVVRLRAAESRAITADDRWNFREAGGYERDRAADPLRRVVRLVPERPLPHGCAGELVLPATLDQGGGGKLVRWSFSTYGDFKVVRATCAWDRANCPTGPIIVSFSTPVSGAEVQRRLKLRPEVPFTVSDTSDTRADWRLEARLAPRTWYAVVADTGLRDVFGQRLTGNPVAVARSTGYAPAINYPAGRAMVERQSLRTFGVTYVNVDTLEVVLAPIPDSLEARFLARSEWRWAELWPQLLPGAIRRKVPVTNARDQVRLYGVKLPVSTPARRLPTLMAMQVTSPQLDSFSRARRPISVVQVTDLGVHARIGAEEGVVWVTGASDGKPRAGASVVLRDARGKTLATAVTDAGGVARLRHYRPAVVSDTTDEEDRYSGFEGYVAVTLGGDRAVVGISEYDPDLSPWRFNVSSAWGVGRLPVAAAVFTERGIYRPGEPLYAKAIVRTGLLGNLAAPAPSDSLRWIFRDRSGQEGPPGTLKDTTVALSAFGTADFTFRVPPTAALGTYDVAVQLRRRGTWADVANASYRIAEYRPPEFLVDVVADSAARYPRDSVRTSVEARYLFGAPMARAAVSWVLRQRGDAELPEIPNTEGWSFGDMGWWWEEMENRPAPVEITASGTDTLDAAGRLALKVPLGETVKGRPSVATFDATVKDVNRQTVSASTSVVVHPASFYLGLKPSGKSYFWVAGTPVTVDLIAVRPDGVRESGVRVTGAVVRREWHQTHRERDGYGEVVGEWVSDTVARCALVTATDPVPCRFTPAGGGTYIVNIRARDRAGREVSSSVIRWATGKDWVPWNDESQFKMDVIPDRTRYTVGDTATVLFASPFTNAEAWVTVEREGLIEQRRLKLTSGSTTLKFPITEAFAPNAFVSIIVARGRSAAPGKVDDAGRPTLRVGYAELRVTPERKRLTVTLKADRAEYRPGDTARVALQVRDAAGAGQASEVTLWAVDAGVLALTGYRTPDPIDLLYRPRGLGLRLASNLVSVVPQVPEGEKGKRHPGGGGGLEGADVLRSRFQTTAFFLGSVVTDAAGNAVASAKLPDNLTTFRVMAVAVTARDRYGAGESSLLVTRPLLARPALPRFLREGDRFDAGVVVNQRLGGTPAVDVTASATGVKLVGRSAQRTVLEAGRGREMRFGFQGIAGDSATFRFRASSGNEGDGVQLTLPVKPAYHPRSYTVAGLLVDSSTAELALTADIDPARSELVVSLGTSPVSVIRGAYEWLRVYPYWCTEQLSSGAQPLIALYRAGQRLEDDSIAGPRVKRDLLEVIATLERRQRADGGIGMWSATDWTTPWVSSYAGQVLLDAKALGLPVSDSVLARLGGYLQRSLAQPTLTAAPVSLWWDTTAARLSERVMAVDYLSRAGLRDRAAENELLRAAPQLYWEDRARLAGVLARGGDVGSARRLLEPAWASVTVEGRTATLPPASRRDWYFASITRPASLLLSATLAVEPNHPLVGPLVETLIQQGRGERWVWNTQDYGMAVVALADFWARQQDAATRGVRLLAGGKPVLQVRAQHGAAHDSAVSLARFRLTEGKLRLTLQADGPGAPVYYWLTARTVPRVAPVTPDDQGIQVERWYERPGDAKPVVSVAAGELVRVRLRITVPTERRFVILDDALPAGLEAIDLSLRTVGGVPGPGAADTTASAPADDELPGEGVEGYYRWAYGSWDAGWWSPFDHKEIRDDRVVYVATVLWKGSYTASYLARATTPGVFVRPPAHAEEMYNPAVFGRSDGGVFTVTAKP
ncbi:MAG TPA: Ig-like domain-containing protein [Gemmatimonadales bacterium]|nr:Ig-like domain-containing protein [Gemmatimonadales bacterium]